MASFFYSEAKFAERHAWVQLCLKPNICWGLNLAIWVMSTVRKWLLKPLSEKVSMSTVIARVTVCDDVAWCTQMVLCPWSPVMIIYTSTILNWLLLASAIQCHCQKWRMPCMEKWSHSLQHVESCSWQCWTHIGSIQRLMGPYWPVLTTNTWCHVASSLYEACFSFYMVLSCDAPSHL